MTVSRLVLAGSMALAACAGEPARPAPTVASESPPAAPVPKGADLRYLALGDSFTAGTGSAPAASFPARLADRLRAAARGVTLSNLGVNGFTTQDLIDVELPQVAGFGPTFVTLAIGANDLVRGSAVAPYRAQVRRILGAVVAAGVSADRIVVVPQPDWSRSPAAAGFGDPASIHAQIVGFNAALREEGTAAGARWADLFPRMEAEAARGMIAGDGLHPSAAAYDEWAADLVGSVPP